ncbi:YeeE/YedE family protein [Salinibius halmophilus]|uniref:YeeE/YedE family protein n=1 Tax=Salinibius halmophilus TaxID=1853216 RepID=UPI000E6720D5|nr:YeeE/YedE family protein [Salinibius halmophilus]
MTATTHSTAKLAWPIDRFVTTTAALMLLVLGWLIYIETAPFLLALFVIGTVMGIALFHGSLGFTGAWRNFVLTGKATGMRAQLLMLAVATVLIVPLVSGVIDVGASGTSAPLGVSLVVGSFIFGFGMQLGGACGSGTLFTAGSGNTRMVITLMFFILGAFIGSMHHMWWMNLPAAPAVILHQSLGPWLAIIVQLAVIAFLWWFFGRREKKMTGSTGWGLTAKSDVTGIRRIISGPWPLLWAALVLAVGNMLTVIISGSPWGITFAYALWGAKVAQAVGIDVAANAYWSTNFASMALSDSVLVNVNSVMAIGVLLGAMLATGLANRFKKACPPNLAWKSVAAAIIGGLLMGYGGRVGFGCNIGALFSGVASASLHAWVWFAFAFAGSYLGIKVRPMFGLPN